MSGSVASSLTETCPDGSCIPEWQKHIKKIFKNDI